MANEAGFKNKGIADNRSVMREIVFMEILAHRGFWKTVQEKNSFVALERAFRGGYGVETDIRDFRGELVISHDIATETAVSLDCVLQIYKELHGTGTLALNVKADGIQKLLINLLEKYQISNYFLFDMSVPELVVNKEMELRYYTRHSDVEAECVLYESADGVWMDSFYNETWLTKERIEEHLKKGKSVCIVSPELHKKEHNEVWDMLKQSGLYQYPELKLCTDYPDKAKEYFYG